MKNDPRQITAKFDSICAETGRQIKKGESCIFYPLKRKAFHIDSKQANEFREWKADLNMGYPW